jgi:hypothetical protein
MPYLDPQKDGIVSRNYDDFASQKDGIVARNYVGMGIIEKKICTHLLHLLHIKGLSWKWLKI